MIGTLERLSIFNEDSKEEFSVLFNPSEYTIEDASSWSDQAKMGQKPELHYTGGQRKKLSMELFFHGWITDPWRRTAPSFTANST